MLSLLLQSLPWSASNDTSHVQLVESGQSAASEELSDLALTTWLYRGTKPKICL